MPVIKVLQHDKEAQEAIAEIVTSLHEASQVSRVSLRVFCHSISLPTISNKISLFAFLVTNIVSENTLQAPRKTQSGYFSYRLFARVLDTQNRCVQLGDVDIVLDRPIPKDIPNNSYISFDVVRLDLQDMGQGDGDRGQGDGSVGPSHDTQPLTPQLTPAGDGELPF